MKKLILLGILFLCITIPVCADVAIPEAPKDAQALFGENTDDFGEGLLSILKNAVSEAAPQFVQSAKQCLTVVGAVLVLSVLRSVGGKAKSLTVLAGVLSVSVLLLGSTRSMIEVGTQTVSQISEYGKLLLPVMTTALAAQGGATAAASIYTATALFDTLLCTLISSVFVPMLSVQLVLSIVNAISEDGILRKLKNLTHSILSRALRIALYIFTGYITVTGVIGGTADQAALKAAKLTISGAVPVVGGILADASESVLVSAAVVKNAGGVYGLLAVIAITIVPFLTIEIHAVLLKLASAVAGVFAPKELSDLLEDFSTCMSLVLAMVGSVCLIQLISIVCFLKGMA